VLLADEVGLGKTIEAGIVLCQLWAERKRTLLILCPAALRQQWVLELSEKFNLPAVVAARMAQLARQAGRDPLQQGAITIMPYQYASSVREAIRAIDWHLVVIDEAHRLRNAYRPSNRMGQAVSGPPTAVSCCSRTRRSTTRCWNSTASRPSSTSSCSAIRLLFGSS
jgi:superfamily II DNA or RNA helicase